MVVAAGTSVFDVVAAEATAESPLWAEALRDEAGREPVAVFSPLAQPEHALAIETIYEGYLVHYGVPRLFAPADGDTGLLLGDYLYAHGLVRLAASGGVEAVADMAELISLCVQLRADDRDGDGEAWAATSARLGRGGLVAPRAALRDRGDAAPLLEAASATGGELALARALAAHALRRARPLR
jgi:hypothetical protein